MWGCLRTCVGRISGGFEAERSERVVWQPCFGQDERAECPVAGDVSRDQPEVYLLEDDTPPMRDELSFHLAIWDFVKYNIDMLEGDVG